MKQPNFFGSHQIFPIEFSPSESLHYYNYSWIPPYRLSALQQEQRKSNKYIAFGFPIDDL